MNYEKPVYKKTWFWLVVIFIGLPMLSGFLSVFVPTYETDISSGVEQSEQVEVLEEVVQEEVIQRELLVADADDLFNYLHDNPLKAKQTLQNVYVEVTGRVTNIDSSGKYFSISRIEEQMFDMDSILCSISKEHLDSVMDFQMGQLVTVTGTITSVGEVLGYGLTVESIK